MDCKEIDPLLEKYYEGEASSDEETQLYQFFVSQDIPERLVSEKEAFLSLYEMKGTTYPSEGFQQRIKNKIDQLEDNNKTIHLYTSLKWVSSIAATILVVVSLYFLSQPKSNNSIDFDHPIVFSTDDLKTLEDDQLDIILSNP
ncbi:MAG: hypothetical protein MI922_23400, partial [Bacteroidales bacterium]|nr:hypothetical protein [Bacteroidales bacterium]